MAIPGTPYEWVAFNIFILISCIPVLTVCIFGASRWRLWFKMKSFSKPSFLVGGGFYVMMLLATSITGAVGTYLYWVNGQHSVEDLMAGDADELSFNSTFFYVSMMLFLIRNGLASMMYSVFFDGQMFHAAWAFSFLVLGSIATEIAFYWMENWLFGLLLLFSGVFYLWTFAILWGVTMGSVPNKITGWYFVDPLETIYDHLILTGVIVDKEILPVLRPSKKHKKQQQAAASIEEDLYLDK